MKLGWWIAFGVALVLVGGMRPAAAQTLYTGGTYVQNFDSLANSGTGNAWTDNVTLTGWYASRSAYNAGTGSSNTGAIYSFGTNGGTPSTERALGSVASDTTGTIQYGVRIRNTTGATISAFQISYRGEQWRNSGNTTPHQLGLAVSTDATSLTSGTYANQPLLGYIGPVATSTVGALDGNSNFVSVSGTISGINWSHDTDLWIRWTDTSDLGADHGLAIDDLNISAASDTPTVPEPGGLALLLPALFAVALTLRRKRAQAVCPAETLG